jgi:hypothetical protein
LLDPLPPPGVAVPEIGEDENTAFALDVMLDGLRARLAQPPVAEAGLGDSDDSDA